MMTIEKIRKGDIIQKKKKKRFTDIYVLAALFKKTHHDRCPGVGLTA